jgi:transposase
VLEGMVRSPKTEQRQAKRARVVLLAAERMPTRQIARLVGFSIGKASQWRVRSARDRLAGLEDKPRPGSEPKYSIETDRRILPQLDEPPPAGYGRWTAPLLSRVLGNISDQYSCRFLRAQKIDLAGRKSWWESPNPDFSAKAAEIVGLYLDPPDKAVVLAVDEKPNIQALERKQGYLKLVNGRSLVGHGHTYKRHGTTTLFAALPPADVDRLPARSRTCRGSDVHRGIGSALAQAVCDVAANSPTSKRVSFTGVNSQVLLCYSTLYQNVVVTSGTCDSQAPNKSGNTNNKTGNTNRERKLLR